MRVGIVGIGGLGHLAIKIASAMGAFVTGITSTKEKKKEILSLGADSVITDDEIPAAQAKKEFDVILCCISGGDFDKYIKMLKFRGKFLMVGLPHADSANRVDINNVVLNEICVEGSLVGTNDDLD